MRSVTPKVRRSGPVDDVEPDRGEDEAGTMDTRDLGALPPPSPTKEEKVRNWMAKNSGGPK